MPARQREPFASQVAAGVARLTHTHGSQAFNVDATGVHGWRAAGSCRLVSLQLPIFLLLEPSDGAALAATASLHAARSSRCGYPNMSKTVCALGDAVAARALRFRLCAGR